MLLLINSVIERGLSGKENDKSPNLLDTIPQETIQELKGFSEGCLQKAGLVELNEKLHSLSSVK